ncbi:unnamed protein product [Allacma fusca]|uniref:Uncharacterized protein n=1 Tax=Allacma fusca TaxID=39272 RepID=A0A8J2KVU9_9HEXA|nr:unnamed protein product [Allacma fusca]
MDVDDVILGDPGSLIQFLNQEVEGAVLGEDTSENLDEQITTPIIPNHVKGPLLQSIIETNDITDMAPSVAPDQVNVNEKCVRFESQTLIYKRYLQPSETVNVIPKPVPLMSLRIDPLLAIKSEDSQITATTRLIVVLEEYNAFTEILPVIWIPLRCPLSDVQNVLK